MCLAKTVEPIEMPAETWVPGGAQKTIHIHTTHTNLYSARNRENESEDLLTGGGQDSHEKEHFWGSWDATATSAAAAAARATADVWSDGLTGFRQL